MEKITYAGHSAIFIQSGDRHIAIDPWLHGNPLCPAALKEPDALDLIVLTHGHSDHAADALPLASKYGCQVLATYELAQALIAEGVSEDTVIAMNKGGTVEVSGLAITLTEAKHSNSFDGSKGTVYAGEACGVVLSNGSVTLYHAGDTALFSDMKLIKEQYRPTIGFIPIGDRFTMGPLEAAEATKLLELEKVIPIHHSTFPLLTGTPSQFLKALEHASVEVVILEPGQVLELD